MPIISMRPENLSCPFCPLLAGWSKVMLRDSEPKGYLASRVFWGALRARRCAPSVACCPWSVVRGRGQGAPRRNNGIMECWNNGVTVNGHWNPTEGRMTEDRGRTDRNLDRRDVGAVPLWPPGNDLFAIYLSVPSPPLGERGRVRGYLLE